MTVFDVCCDHGYIGFSALKTAKKVVFVDQSPNALISVREHILSLSDTDRLRVEVHAIPGELIDLDGETSADFIIAGVGVTTIVSIVAALFPEGLGSHRLILSPQQDSLPLRWFLREKGLKLAHESVVEERGRYREILHIGAEGVDVGEEFLADDDKAAKDYREHMRKYREQIAGEKSGH